MKLTALQSPLVRRLLSTADSMAWSFAARKAGRDANSIKEAIAFVARVLSPPKEPEQYRLDFAA